MTRWQGLCIMRKFFLLCYKYTKHYQQNQDVCKDEFCEKVCLCKHVCWGSVFFFYLSFTRSKERPWVAQPCSKYVFVYGSKL